MRYLYYPGCSLKGTGRAYEESLLAVQKAMGVSCEEIDDWNCCGATAYMSVDANKAHALAARNLALAETQGRSNGEHTNGEGVQVIAPCNACYLVLAKAQRHLEDDALGDRRLLHALQEVGLNYDGKVQVRHPLDVLMNDIGADKIKEQVKAPLSGMKVACYYGCQIVRPYASFDNQNNPVLMDQLMELLGAEPVPWSVKARCCGGSLTGTIQEVGLRLSYIILKEAKRLGADAVATACPLCQFNLECYQQAMTEEFNDVVDMPVLYFSQLMGKAFGLTEKELGMKRLFVPLKPKCRAPEPVATTIA